jgi:hypothetical protein
MNTWENRKRLTGSCLDCSLRFAVSSVMPWCGYSSHVDWLWNNVPQGFCIKSRDWTLGASLGSLQILPSPFDLTFSSERNDLHPLYRRVIQKTQRALMHLLWVLVCVPRQISLIRSGDISICFSRIIPFFPSGVWPRSRFGILVHFLSSEVTFSAR